jgi:hypothetical protein
MLMSEEKRHFMADVTTIKKKSRNANSDMRKNVGIVEQGRNANSMRENTNTDITDVAFSDISFPMYLEKNMSEQNV